MSSNWGIILLKRNNNPENRIDTEDVIESLEREKITNFNNHITNNIPLMHYL
jgi:hypothetical protein